MFDTKKAPNANDRLQQAVKNFDAAVQEFITETSTLPLELGTIAVSLPDYVGQFRVMLAQMIAARRNRAEAAKMFGVQK